MSSKSRKWKYLLYEIEERWERFGLKKWINLNPRVVIGIAAVSFLLFIVIAIGQLIPDKPAGIEEPKKVWFYDINSKQLFAAKTSNLPPIKAPSGPLPDGTPAGVRAYVFASNDPNGTEPVIGFLETFSPEGKEIQKTYDSKKHDAKQWAEGRLFRRPNDKEWVPADSPEGQAIYEKFLIHNNNEEIPAQSKN